MQGPVFLARLRSVATRACLLATVAIVAACSTDGMLDVRPAVDIGDTASIRPARVVAAPRTYAEPAAPQVASEPAAATADAGFNGGDPADMAAGAEDFDGRVEAALRAPAPSAPPQAQASVIRPVAPPRTYEAAFPRMSPRVEPSVSSEEAACRKELQRAGVRFEDMAPIRKSASCYIDNPVKVSSIGNVQMKPAATLTCRMALTFAQWTNKELVPSARWRYFTGIKAIRQGSSYSCRSIAGSRTPSAHSTGNALDVMAIELNNGKVIDVRKQGFFAFRAKKLLNNVRADGCEYFTTVLGPGYNYDHRNHFHFDLMERRNGRRACH